MTTTHKRVTADELTTLHEAGWKPDGGWRTTARTTGDYPEAVEFIRLWRRLAPGDYGTQVVRLVGPRPERKVR